MKNLVYLILGIILGITTLRLAFGAFILLINFHVISAILSAIFGYVTGILTVKCFDKI